MTNLGKVPLIGLRPSLNVTNLDRVDVVFALGKVPGQRVYTREEKGKDAARRQCERKGMRAVAS